MALASEVHLDKAIEAVFPKSCIVCQQPPDSRYQVWFQQLNSWLVAFVPILIAFGWTSVKVPMCQSCKPKFWRQRWGRQAICWTLGIGLFCLCWPYFDDWSPVIRRVAMIGVGIMIFAPWHWPNSGFRESLR
jgi:hypothetical protein